MLDKVGYIFLLIKHTTNQINLKLKCMTNPKSKSNSWLTTGFYFKLDFATTQAPSHPNLNFQFQFSNFSFNFNFQFSFLVSIVNCQFSISSLNSNFQYQNTAIYPKQKLLVYIRWLWNMFWKKPRPKNHPLRVKNCRKPFDPRFLWPR